MNTWDFSGSIQVTHKGKIVYETSRGFSNIEYEIKNNRKTRYHIASVTKQFTAYAIMMLYDKGFMHIHEKANSYLPKNIQLPSNITVHQLLSHTSGLYNFYNFEDDFYVFEDRLPYNKEQFLKRWILKNYKKDVHNQFSYNNSNYNILAWIIEHVSGMEYSEFLKENIFQPLGMMDSDIDNGLNILHKKAQNYMRDYGKVIKIPYTKEEMITPIYS